jgi:hypothetical protein
VLAVLAVLAQADNSELEASAPQGSMGALVRNLSAWRREG